MSVVDGLRAARASGIRPTAVRADYSGMSRIESAKKIEGIVGAKRHATDHLGRAVSVEHRVYILHSQECVASGIDLRDCVYSDALDIGIELLVWAEFQDIAVTLRIDDEYGDLTPTQWATSKEQRR